MNPPESWEPDPLAELLGDRLSAPADDSLKSAVLAQTMGMLRRRRFVKRCGRAAGWLGCYLAGAFSVWVWHGSVTDGSPEVVLQPAVPGRPAAPKEQARPTVLATVATPVPDIPESRFEVLRGQGDRELQRTGDVQVAIRYYARALDFASQDELAISVEKDHWLMMALKDARLQEMKNASNEG